MKYLAGLVLCLGLAHVANAQQDRGMYIGGGLGTFDYSEPEDVSFAVSDSTWIYSLFGGYQFSQYFGLEFAISGTGDDLEENFTDFVVGNTETTLEENIAYDIYTLHAMGILPFESVSLFAGVGYFSASLNVTIDAPGFGTLIAGSDHESGASATIGIQKNFKLDLENFAVRGQYHWYDFDNGIDGSAFVIGATYRF